VEEGRRAMGRSFTVGEGVVWVTNFGLDHRMDAEIVRIAHGRVLIRVLERAANQQRAQFVERWVEPESLRKS
jgi:hypothetical protein